MTEHTFHSAFALISSLRVGDQVRVTREGRTADLIVSFGPRRSDGQYGSPESLHVVVSYGPGRYAFNVGVDHLWRRRAGRGWLGGGTELELIGCGQKGCRGLDHSRNCFRYEIPMDPETEKQLTIMFSHLADDHGESDEPTEGYGSEEFREEIRKSEATDEA
jgi:hypothetical protein